MHIEWTEENIKFLKDHIHIKHKSILEAYLKTSRRTIKRYADKDGILLKTPGWTKEDEEFLKNNYDYKNKDIQIELGCSTKRISKISNQLKSTLDNPTPTL